MSEYDKELDSSREEWEKAREPLDRSTREVSRPDDAGRDSSDDTSGDDQSGRSDRISK